MAEQVGTLVARLVADVEGLRADMAKARKIIESSTAKSNRALSKFERQTKSITKSFNLFRNAVLLVGGASVLGRLIGGVKDAGIAMQALERRFKTAVGTSAAAAREFGFVRQESERLGLDLEAAATGFSSLAAAAQGTSLAGEGVRQIFLGVAEAARVLNLSGQRTEGVLRAIEQIISKGRVSAEELRQQLGEQLPGAFQITARSIGVTTMELDRMLEAGELTADFLLPRLAAELRKTFGPEVEAASMDAQASFNRLKNSVFELKAAIAESGILDALAGFADVAAAAAERLAIAFGKIPETIAGITEEIARLQAAQQFETLEGNVRGRRTAEIEFLQEKLDLLQRHEVINRVLQNQLITVTARPIGEQEDTRKTPEIELLGLGDRSFEDLETIIVDPYLRATERIRAAQREVAAGEELLTELMETEGQRRKTASLETAKTTVTSALGALALVGRGSKTAFKLQKKLSIASALINTYESVTKNLAKYPGPKGFALAALSLAAGLAQVQQIRSTSFQSSGGGARSVGAGRASAILSQPDVPQAAQPGNDIARTAVQIIFQGDVFGWDRFMQERVIESLREAVDERDVIIIGAESRQAAELLPEPEPT